MADIEERLRGHSTAFQGLLSLDPEQQGDITSQKLNKGKQSKKDSKKPKKSTSGNATSGTDGETLLKVKTEVGGKQQEGKKKKQKSQNPGAQKISGEPSKDDVPKMSSSSAMTNGIPKSVGNNSSRKQTPKKSDKPPQGTPPVNGISRTGPIANGIKSPQIAYQEIQKNGVSSTSSSTPASDSSPDTPSTTTTSEAPEPPPTPKAKPEFDSAARAEARARLAARIEALRAKRHADGPDGAPARNRQELMEARRKKEAARKERKKELRLASKAAEEKAAKADAAMEGSSTDVRMQGTTSLSKPQQSKPIETNFSFGQVVFDDGQTLDHTLQNFQKSRKRKGPTDVLGQMKHVEAKKARIANMLPEKQEHIAEKEMWSKALKQAQGEKVRDDEKLLKKALKRQEKTKKKSEREWKERTQSVVKSKFAKQKKRETNIAARKEQKKAGKNGVKKKKPAAADSKNRKNRKKSRPGFEGSMKSGKTAGGGGGGGGGGGKKK